MTDLFLAWGIGAFVIALVAIGLGRGLGRGNLGILIDNRGRYSLSQLQLTLWTIVLLSLFGGVYFVRLLSPVDDPLGFQIPNELLIVLGMSVGAAATSSVLKSDKDSRHPDGVAASDLMGDKPRVIQIFLLEEGDLADQVVDVTKFQNFWITMLLLVAYVALVVDAASGKSIEAFALPGFQGTFLTLLGISHAGYLAGKLPSRPGTPPGLTVAGRRRGDTPGTPAASESRAYQPRNPISSA